MANKIKPKRIRKTFAERFYDKLSECYPGKVEMGGLSDGSSIYIGLRKGKKSMEISFCPKGEKITKLGVWKDVIEVVDQDKIF